jgi:hypothetical protein
MVVAIALARIRTGRGGLGWWTLFWVSFIGLLLFVWPNRANSLVRSPHHMGCRPGPGRLKRAWNPTSPPQRSVKPEHCAPERTTHHLA